MRLAARTPSAQLLGTAHLPNWSLSFYKRSKDESGKCTVHRGSSGVHFAIFEMSANDKLTLDAIEGVGNGYDEIRLEVPAYGECFTYIAQDTFIDASLQPYDWYKSLVLAGAKYHGFPGDYVRQLESTAAIPDPDPRRSVEQWDVVNKVITTHC